MGRLQEIIAFVLLKMVTQDGTLLDGGKEWIIVGVGIVLAIDG